jgi:hypothetical protein
VPEEDYMADITDKIEQIKRLVDSRSYFTINRARQYGKTTTLAMLERALKDEYTVASISFEGLGDESFESPEIFCRTFLALVRRALRFASAKKEYADKWVYGDVKTFVELSEHITELCKGKKLVLMIDEVDKTSNNRVFLHFLSMLREKFLARKNGKDSTFHSVILAGVYDIKNIKLKMIQEGAYAPAANENKIYNSPWNIAVDFEVDMSLGPSEIASMLAEYENDHHTGMDISAIADEIYSYTSGYPFLASRVCKHIDEKLAKDWTAEGVQNAVKIILAETNTLFDDMFKNLENNGELSDYIYKLLILGKANSFVVYDSVVSIGIRYGFFKNVNGRVAISNRIFELLMTDYFMEKDIRNAKQVNGVLQRDIVRDGRFDMELCLRKFTEHYAEIYNEGDTEFLERHGRLLFLSYLKPLINGQGFYDIESQFTDLRRMDIAVDFGRQQFIIELKLWRGEQYRMEAYSQLCGYLESKRANTGYMLTFDFRKESGKVRRAEWVETGGKRIFDVIV